MTDARRVDAVVVLGGGRGERLARGLSLRAETQAPVLVLCDGARQKHERRGAPTTEGRRLAASATGFEVLCPIPDPYRTRGEVRLVAAFARARGWRRVVVVTSDYHVRRTRMLMARCTPEGCEVEVVSARSSIGPLTRTASFVHEVGGMLHAALLARGC